MKALIGSSSCLRSTATVTREVEHAADRLYEMALELCGVSPAVRRRERSSAVAALTQGEWYRDAICGRTPLPCVGELVQSGSIGRFFRTIDLIDSLIRNCPTARRMLIPAMTRVRTLLCWIPKAGNSRIASLQQRFGIWCPRGHSIPLPDVRRRFIFHRPEQVGNHVYRTATGRLGVPGLVQVHRDGKTHTQIGLDFPGNDAGHLIAARFGARDCEANLVAMNRNMNRGIFNHGQEEHWSELLRRGYGIDATVTAVFRPGEQRPFTWRVEWIETSPLGDRVHREPNLLYGNFPVSASERNGQ